MTVGSLSEMSGVSVRTLHHYDAIGLLRPTSRSAAGYRLYTADDAERLRDILVFRNLGLTLEQVGQLLDDDDGHYGDDGDARRSPRAARVAVLRAQRELTAQRLALQQQRIELIDRILQEPEGRLTMTTESFDKLPDVDEYAQEARERWGDTDEYRESARRSARYGKADWARIAAAQREQLVRFASLLTAGAAPDSEESMAAAEEARRFIDEWFYPLTPEMHRGLAEMYIADPRFKAHYDEAAPGLAQFVHDAINANADRARSGATG